MWFKVHHTVWNRPPILDIYIDKVHLYCLPCISVFHAAGNRILPVALNQLEENAVLIGYDKYAKFVDKQGKLKPSNKQASQLSFDNKAQAIGKAYICKAPNRKLLIWNILIFTFVVYCILWEMWVYCMLFICCCKFRVKIWWVEPSTRYIKEYILNYGIWSALKT